MTTAADGLIVVFHDVCCTHLPSQVTHGQTQTSQAKAQRFKVSAMRYGLTLYALLIKRNGRTGGLIHD